MAYAQNTSVTVERSKQEVETLLRKHGAKRFVSGWDEDQNIAFVMFDLNDLRIRFHITMPTLESCMKTPKGRQRSKKDAHVHKEQEVKRRWRSLCFTIKSKFISIEDEVESFEQAFFGQILLPNGQTSFEALMPAVTQAIESGQMPTSMIEAPYKVEEGDFKVVG